MLRKNLNEFAIRLSEDPQFLEFDNNEDRVEYIFQNGIHRNDFEKMFSNRTNIVRSAQKSYQMSKQYFDEAYDEFVKQDTDEKNDDQNQAVIQILTNLEKAIIYAPHERQRNQVNVLLNAFKLRSKIYLKNNFFENFIFDYVHALEVCEDTYSRQQLKDEVIEWVEPSKRGIIKNIDMNLQKQNIIEKPSFKMDKRCLVLHDQQKGRHMIAKESIEKDRVLIIEKPQILQLDNKNRDKYCSNCCTELIIGFYPCSGCIECRFCTRDCAQQAYNEFHRYECGIVGYVSVNISNYWLVGYKLLVSSGINDIKQLHEISNKNGEGFDLNEWIEKHNNKVVPKNQDEILNQYKGFSTFEDHSDKKSIRHILREIIDAIEMVLLIDVLNVLDLRDDRNFIRLVSTLIKNYNKCSVNAFGFVKNDKLIARYMALVSTMMNHSCVPNSVWNIFNGLHRVVSFTDIKAGEEISISYGLTAMPEILYHPLIERQQHLRQVYHFVCNCIGCTRDQSGLTSILKCRLCRGTVYYGSINPNRMCVDCGETDKIGYYDKLYFDCIRVYVEVFNEAIERDFHTEESLNIAEKCLQRMSVDCESGSPDLQKMRQTFNSINQ